MPAISVLLAVYNGMPFLPTAMESIFSQTHSDFEFLIVDDHSTDGSRPYLETLKDPRLRILTNPGKGLTSALNFGLEQATGDWIARMDADDWSFPTRFEHQVKAAQIPGTVLISGDHIVCDEDLNPVGEVHLCSPNPKLFSYFHKKNNPFCHPLMMFDRKRALEVGGYRFERAQDYDLWVRLLEKGELVHVGEILLKYRVCRNAISIQHVKEQSQTKKVIQDRVESPIDSKASKESSNGQYEYRLGFAAWLSGNRGKAISYFTASSLKGSNVIQCLIGMALLVFPLRWYLVLAGYRGVYKAAT